jgi:hypothetical protein
MERRRTETWSESKIFNQVSSDDTDGQTLLNVHKSNTFDRFSAESDDLTGVPLQIVHLCLCSISILGCHSRIGGENKIGGDMTRVGIVGCA